MRVSIMHTKAEKERALICLWASAWHSRDDDDDDDVAAAELAFHLHSACILAWLDCSMACRPHWQQEIGLWHEIQVSCVTPRLIWAEWIMSNSWEEKRSRTCKLRLQSSPRVWTLTVQATYVRCLAAAHLFNSLSPVIASLPARDCKEANDLGSRMTELLLFFLQHV